jgi:peptidoglycan hydrolase-like protein with peptidoglycan-binding domain
MAGRQAIGRIIPTIAGWVVLALFASLVLNGPAAAANVQLAARGDPPELDRRQNRQYDPLVERIQRGLARYGLYKGDVDGIMGPKTEKAIRTYQRRIGIRADGQVTEELAGHVETGDKVEVLLKRLEKTRQSNTEAARQALLSNPATRGLITFEPGDIADPTRDATPCFEKPSISCLLSEASESAKAVHRDELRDWALGELLTAQARAGLPGAAMDTAGRIGDPRLIMVALRDIAEAQARARRTADALEAAAIIPDAERQAEAFAAIAKIQADHDHDGLGETLDWLDDAIGRVEKKLRRVSLMCRAAVILSEAGSEAAAKSKVEAAHELAIGLESVLDRETALRSVASAMAEMGDPESALTILDGIDGKMDKTPVLVAAAKAQAKAGNPARALETASGIESGRYKAVVLSSIAVAQAGGGDTAAATDTLETAVTAAESVKLPFARDFALGRISLAFAGIARFGETEVFQRAVQTAETITDTRLKAHTLWTITVERGRNGDSGGADQTRQLARTATDAMKSPLSRVWMFGDIAKHYATESEEDAAWNAFADGLKLAADIENAWARSRALSRLALTLIEMTAQPTIADPTVE